jgi:hypothetical protein
VVVLWLWLLCDVVVNACGCCGVKGKTVRRDWQHPSVMYYLTAVQGTHPRAFLISKHVCGIVRRALSQKKQDGHSC